MAVKSDRRYARKDTRTRRTRNTPMSERQIVGFLGRKIHQAMNSDDDDISENRKENFNYYVGAEYGNEREGYSKFVTREALETIEWVLPSVLRVFLSGDKIVTFEPSGPDDEAQADQETDITNYFVMRANKNGEGGFLTLHHWMKDALMNPNAYVKVYMEDKTCTDVGTVSGLTPMGVQQLFDDPNVTILEQRSRTITIDREMAANHGQMPQMGQLPNMQMPPNVVMMQEQVEVFDLKIRTAKDVKILRIDPVPPEEALIDNDCTSPNVDEADFTCHRRQRAYSDLVREGIDPKFLDQVGQGEHYQWNDERVNRLFYSDENPDSADEDDPSMREFWVHECTAWFDNDGDGVAEHHAVLLIGDQVAKMKETNYQPFVSLSSILMPHKHNGMSYIDIVKDLQILSSVLVRQLLDNVYKQNVARKVFSEDALTEDGSTMEAMLNTQAEYIPVRGPAVNAFAPEPVKSIVSDLLPVIQYVSEAKVVRTGVSPETSVDPNALQEVRQDVFANAMDRASQRVEMLVRIFAETGYRFLMLKVHQLLRSHWDVERTVKIRGKWVDVDPQGWRDRSDMSVEVGLGFNSKPMVLAMVANLLSTQKEAIAAGLSNPKKIYNALEKMVNAGGLGDVRDYFVDPESEEYQPPQPQPDANMILAQAQAQALGQEQQRKAMEMRINAKTEAQNTQIEAQIKLKELEGKQLDRQIKIRELAIKEAELEQAGIIKRGELNEIAAKIRNTDADTQLKHAQADKAMADAASTIVEAADAHEAMEMAAEGGEMAEKGSENNTDRDDKRDES